MKVSTRTSTRTEITASQLTSTPGTQQSGKYQVRALFVRCLCILAIIAGISVSGAKAQLTGPKSIPGDYPTLADAITDLNTQGVGVGGVTFTVNAGNPQTAPAGGYIIGGTGSAVLTSSSTLNPIIIEGSLNTVTAGVQAAGALNDAIFKLKGADWVTIQHFTMQENAANTVVAVATNTMTEWAVALLYATVTDGAQNNTVLGNTISLNGTYNNSFAVYSNTRHVDGPAASDVTTVAAITNNTTGPNSNNKVYGNTISNVNIPFLFIGCNDGNNNDVGNDIGGSSAATGNNVTGYAAAGVGGTAYNGLTITTVNGAYILNQVNYNFSYNSMISASLNSSVTLTAIIANYVNFPIGTFTNNITNNTITFTQAGTGAINAILTVNGALTPMPAVTLNVNNNSIINNVISNAGSTGIFFGIANTGTYGTLNMNGNIFHSNTSAATGFGFIPLHNQGVVVNAVNINNNQVGTNAANAITFSAASTGATTIINNTGAATTATVTIDGNTIQGVSCVTSGQMVGILNTAAVAGTVNLTNNILGNASRGWLSYSAATTANIFGIINNAGTATMNLNINGNSTQGSTAVTTGQFLAFNNNTGGLAGGIINMNNNKAGTTTGPYVTFSGAQSVAVLAVANQGGTATSALSMSGNDVRGIVHSVAASASHTYFLNSFATLSQNISNNTFTNLSVNTTGAIIFINHSVATPTGGSTTINNNSIVTGFTKAGAASGAVTLTNTTAAPVAGTTLTQTGNNFSNITVAGSSTITGITNTGGTSTKTITGNTFNNWVAVTGAIVGMNITSLTGASSISSNILTNWTNTAAITGITIGSTLNTATPLNVNSNTITGLSSTGTGGSVTGITCANVSGFVNINSNTINTLASSGASSAILGITITNAVNTTVNANRISGFTGTGLTAPTATGISVTGGTTVTLNGNKICDIAENGVSTTTTTTAVNGMLFSGGLIINATNNIIGNLSGPATNNIDAIRGISVTSTTANSSYNIYNNTVYLSGTSSGTNFGSTGIFHVANATATTAKLDLRNNIVVNNTTPKGTGIASALKRGTAATLGNYATTSNYNMYYAGTPGANNAILNDGATLVYGTAGSGFAFGPVGTVGSFQNFVTAARESASFTETVSPTAGVFFQSFDCTLNGTFLHLVNGLTTRAESGGTPIAGLTTDFDGNTRNASFPDVGADEFNGVTTAPTISNVSIPTATCTASAHVINADITTPSGNITSVTLNYTNALGSPVTMTLSSGNTYTGTIPAGTPGAIVTWSITANSDVPASTTYNGTPYTDDPLSTVTVSATAVPNPVCSGSTVTLTAATTITTSSSTIGTGTNITGATESLTAFCNRFTSFQLQQVYTPAELSAAGLTAGKIFGMTFTIGTLGDGATNSNYTVKMGTAPGATLTTFITSGLTTVFGPVTYTHAIGTNTVTFTTPYVWDGVSNIVFDVTHGGANLTNNAQTYFTTMPGNTTAFGLNGTATATLSTSRLNVSFLKAAPFTVSWSDGVGVVGTTNPLNVNPTSNTTYTATISALGCTKNAPVAVTTIPLPATPLGSNSTQCGVGSPVNNMVSQFTLPDVSSQAFRWYATEFGGTPLQVGGTNYTGTISSTTTFWVSESNGTCESLRYPVVETVDQPDPITAAVDNNNPCANTAINLSVSNNNDPVPGPTQFYTYTWSATPVAGSGLVGSPTGSTLTVTPTIPGNYVYTASGVSGICTAVSSVPVTVKALPEPVVIVPPSAALCAGQSVTLNASSGGLATPLSLNFETGLGSWTTANNTTGGVPANVAWTIRTNPYTYPGTSPGSTGAITFNSGGIAGSKFILTNSDFGGTGTSANTILTSPAFSTMGYSNLTLTFSHYLRWLSSAATVQVSTNGSTWTTVQSYVATVGAPTAFVSSGPLNLNAYVNNPSLQVRFNYTGAWDYFWALDDILVTSNLPISPITSWSAQPGLNVYTGSTVIANPLVTTTYTATATAANGCISTGDVTVTINQLPAAPSGTNSSKCGTHVPTASVSSNSGATTPVFRWYSADAPGGTLLQQGTSTTYLSPISITTEFYVAELSEFGCEGPRVHITAESTVADAIHASVSAGPYCLNNPITLNVTKDAGVNFYNYVWTAVPAANSGIPTSVDGDDQPGTDPGNPVPVAVTPSAEGTFVYTVSANDDLFGCTTVSTVTVIINPKPTTVVAASTGTPCVGSAIGLTSSAQTGGPLPISYSTGFEGTFPPTGWVITNVGGGNTWILNTGITGPPPAHTGTQALALLWHATNNANTWAFAPGQALIAGHTYTITFWYNTASFAGTYPEKLKATVGTAATVPAQTTILWDNNGGANISNETYLQATASFIPSTSGTYYFALNGYSDADKNVLLVDDFSVVDATPLVITGYSWVSSNNNPPFTSNQQNPTGVVINETTTYTVTVTNSFGCSETAQVTVIPNALPASPIGTNSQQCGLRIPTASVSTGGANGTFNWYANQFGGTALQTGGSTYALAIGTTTTFWVAEFNGTCESLRTAVTVTVVQPDAVTAHVDLATVCANSPISLSATNNNDPTPTNTYVYTWTATPVPGSGIPTNVVGNPAAVTPTAGGTYQYLVTAFDDDDLTGPYAGYGGCTVTSTVSVLVKPQPLITSATATPATSCPGGTVNLAAASVPVPPLTAQVGSGTATLGSLTAVGAFYGSYWGNGHAQILITASELNALGFVAGNLTGLSIDISAIGGGVVTTLNGFTIKLAPTAATSITTFQAPTFTTVFGPTNYSPFVGTNTHAFTSPFAWNGTSNLIVDYCFGSGLTGTVGSFRHTVTTTAFSSFVNFNADGAANIGACGITTVSNTSTTRPNIKLTQAAIDLTSTLNWLWNPGALVGPTQTVNPLVTTAYTVTATDPVTSCSSSQIVNVTVVPVSAAPSASPSVSCAGSPVLISANAIFGGTPTYSWTDDNPLTTDPVSTSASFTANPTITTTYTVVVTDGCGNVGTAQSVTVTVNPTPTASIAEGPGPLAICDPSTQTLTAVTTTGSPSYQWTLNGVDIPTATGPTHTISGVSTGVYRVRITETTTNCPNTSAPVTVTINPKPNAVVITPAAPVICNGQSQSLTASGGVILAPGTAVMTGTSPTTSTGTISPFYRLWEGSRKQYLISVAELSGQGLATGSSISSISFNVTGTITAPTNFNGFNIKVGATTDPNLSTAFVASGLSVKYGPAVYTPIVGANTFNFSTPFIWDGSSNVVIEICFDNDPTNTCTTESPICWGNTPTVSVATSFAGSVREIHDDNTATNPRGDICGLTTTSNGVATSTLRPIMTFGVTVVTNPVYTWVPITDITPTTGATVTASPSSTITYTATATIAATGCSNSNTVVVTVNPRPTGVLSGGATYCANTTTPTTLSIAVTGTGPWSGTLSNGTAFSGASSPISVTVPAPLSTTTYTIATLTDNGTSCAAIAADMTGSATVVVNPIPNAPTISIVDNTNGTSTITATNYTGTLTWSNGGSDNPHIVSASGSYYVTQTDGNGCISNPSNIVTAGPSITADPALGGMDITDLADVSQNANVLPHAQVLKLWLPVYNFEQNFPVPNGATRITIDLGTKLVVNPSFNLATAPLSAYFTWTHSVVLGHDIITGDQIAELPGDFDNLAVFEIISSGSCLSDIEANFIVDNHASVVALNDLVPLNNFARLQYGLPTTVSAVRTNVQCNGAADGTITVTASEGTTVTIQLNGVGPDLSGQTTFGPGTYTIIASAPSDISPFTPCTATTTVTITEPPLLVANIFAHNDVTGCFGDLTGSAAVFVTGGTPYTVGAPYHYSWNSIPVQTTPIATGLGAGTYIVTVTDSLGCIKTASVTITQPTEMIAEINSRTNVDCNGNSTGSATVDVTGGTPFGGPNPYTYSWSPGGQTTQTATGLSAGTYIVTVTDSHGCTTTASVTITEPAVLTATASVVNGVSCNGAGDGSATVAVTGGTAPYTYVWSPGGQTNQTATGLVPGPYFVTVLDSHGCSVASLPVTISEPAVLNIAILNSTNNSCNSGSTGSITASAAGGTTSYTYSLASTSGPTGNTTGQISGIFTGLSAGTYTVSVLDAHGCTATSATVTITQPTGTLPDISLGSDYTSNFFANPGTTNTIVYNVSEIAGNPAVGDTIRITKVSGYAFTFNGALTSVTSVGPYTVDNTRWKVDNSNPAFLSLIFDPLHNSSPGMLNCSEVVYVSVDITRNTPNLSTFTLSARLRRANGELNLSNNLNSIVFTAE